MFITLHFVTKPKAQSTIDQLLRSSATCRGSSLVPYHAFLISIDFLLERCLQVIGKAVGRSSSRTLQEQRTPISATLPRMPFRNSHARTECGYKLHLSCSRSEAWTLWPREVELTYNKQVRHPFILDLDSPLFLTCYLFVHREAHPQESATKPFVIIFASKSGVGKP